MYVIGLMSGTSADGVDAALIDINGADPPSVRLMASVHHPFATELRYEILAACDPGNASVDRLCVLQTALAIVYARAVQDVSTQAGLDLRMIDAIGCHGQTVWHQPTPVRIGDTEVRGTLQLASPATLAALTDVPVISDFRTADMAAGGEGAPLVPFADYILFSCATETRAIQNIGGIANVTYLPKNGRTEEIIAFDTGPGNMVIDETVRVVTGGSRTYDEGGDMAFAGTPDRELVDTLMEQTPFFRRSPPKSTGREVFGRSFVHDSFLPACAKRTLNDVDCVATATWLTACSIADAYRRFLPLLPDVIIFGGGGARNRRLIDMLMAALPGVRMARHQDYGIPDEAKEAMAFGILAHATIMGRPSNIPSATGARYPAILGSLTPSPSQPVFPWAGRSCTNRTTNV